MNVPNLVEVSALIGDPSRSAILLSLMDGRALPAGELAHRARISPQTASSHLNKLVNGGLLAVEAHGRHRYYRLSGTEVAKALEGLLSIAPPPKIRSLRQSDEMKKLGYARTCYDHLAGSVGVKLTESLLKRGLLEEAGQEYVLTTKGAETFTAFGVDPFPVKRGRRAFARPCLDWTERRYHLAGSLGAALTNRLFKLEWLEGTSSRAVKVTEAGQEGLYQIFGVSL
ncbi:ArsR/SmtB family transcription factor [Brevibacillus sp. H7]|uniref:ArsR/SmtB family transcription factor n=1 Tax=Brevibacillus sp. H7 TaxID=3349138 RepID=UPI0037F2C4DE